MTTKKLTDYIKQSISVQDTKKEEQPKPTQTRIQFKKETKFQETSIGKIPKDWRLERLSNISSEIRAGGTPLRSRREYWNGDIPFVKIEDMTNSFKYLLTTSETITKEGLENSNAWLVPENSLLLAIYGSLGEVVINKIKVTTNQAILAIIPRNPKDVEYLYYWFLYYKPIWKKYAKPTTQPNLTKEIVENALLPYPPSSEREKIAEILSTVDSAIDRVRRLVERAERLKKGLMQELFTKGIGHKEYKETPIGKIPREWQVKKLDSICQVRHGKRPSKVLPEGPYPIYGAGGLSGYTKDYISEGPWTVIVGRVGVGSVGKVYMAPGRIWVNDNAFYILPSTDKVHTPFIYYALLSRGLEQLAMRSAGGYAIITQALLKKIEIPLPPIEEQKRIAEILFIIDEYINKLRMKLELLEHVKRALMEMLLTGRVRVVIESFSGVTNG
ncbi:MAG: restriction endonuclease subunit S [Desulfurococcaceae archaeon]